MHDQERIQLYYQNSLLDWRNEQRAEKSKSQEGLKHAKPFSSFLNIFSNKRTFKASIKKG